LGWGDTQLKVHLARLVDFELVIAHRADSGGNGLVYELAWSGEGIDGRRFLIGLTNPDQLGVVEQPADTATTPSRSGSDGSRSGSGRPPVGPRSGAGRDTSEGASVEVNRPDPTAGDEGEPDRAVPDGVDDRGVVVGRVAS